MNTDVTSLTRTKLVGIVFIACALAFGFAEVQAENQLSDPEIAHIAYTASAIDIRYAHLALALSENPEIRKFAELMIQDHSAVNKKALALVQTLKVTPQDNAMSRQLNEQAEKLRNELSQLRGEAFDQRYAANELAYHQTVNHVVETQIIPNVKNPEFKELLVSALQTFKAHEKHAEMMTKNVM